PALDLRAFLAARLPEQLVPAHVVPVTALPRTASGKIDRRALPAPDRPASEVPFAPPSTPVTEALATLWSDVLGITPLGIDDGFAALGGDSLSATRLTARIVEAMRIELSAADLLEAGTVRRLAERIEAASGRAAPSPITRQAAAPVLSFAQER